MERFVVGVDADGVLTDMAAFNMLEGRRFYKREPIHLDGYSAREIYEGTKAQEIIFGLKVLDKYCTDSPLRPGARRALCFMNNEGAELHEITARKFVTERNPIGAHYRRLFEDWLKKYQLPFKSIQYCSESFSPRDKYIACSKLDVDVMIEDKPEVALYLAEQGIPVLLFNAPYNKTVNHPNITRVYTWDECYLEVHQMMAAKKEIAEYVPLSREEKETLDESGRISYIDSYRSYIKNLQVNVDAFKRSERRFKLLYRFTKLPFSVLFRASIKGKEHIPYQDGFIIASNHLNSYDQFYISRALGNRQFCGFAASTIENTIRGRMFKFTDGAIFIDRENSESKAMGEEELIRKIMYGKIALIFPEGTRKNKTEEGRKMLQLPFKLGTVSIAQKTGAPILPVSLYHGRHSYIRIGEVQFVSKGEDLVSANAKLEQTISSMTLQSMEEDKPKVKVK